MLMVVSTLSKWFMRWRCDDNFLDNLDKLTLGISKGAALALMTYLIIKLIAVAHDNEWEYLFTGWGEYFTFEMVGGTVIPLILFTFAIRNNAAGIARFAAFIAVARHRPQPNEYRPGCL